MKALNTSNGSSGDFNQAVSRSNELLSCVKTSWKIQEQKRFRERQHRTASKEVNPGLSLPSLKNPNLILASTAGPPPASIAVLEDGLAFLRGMEYGTKQLQSLVRRRGHTNDPTEEIGAIVRQLGQDFKEFASYCEHVLKIQRRKQERRHWELVVQWFQQVANHHSDQLQGCLKLRGEILADQSQNRRKLVERNGYNKDKTNTSFNGTEISAGLGATSASVAATPLFHSPLFTATPPNRNKNTRLRAEDQSLYIKEQSAVRRVQPVASSNSSIKHHRKKTSTISDTRTGSVGTAYGVAYGAAYVGSSSAGYGGSGVRQRRGANNQSLPITPLQEQDEEEKIHSQILIRERKRQTQQRLDEARQAESTLSEVSKLYSKISTLITQQGETLEKIEDDVECALVDVSSGQEELTKLYSIKKGNRPLIIKTFSILIFLIVFMRGYKDR